MLLLLLVGMMLVLFGLPTLLLSYTEDFAREKPQWRRYGLGLVVGGFACMIISLMVGVEGL